MTDEELWAKYGCDLTLPQAAQAMSVLGITFGQFMQGLASRYTQMTGNTIPQREYSEMMRTLARETMNIKFGAHDKDHDKDKERGV